MSNLRLSVSAKYDSAKDLILVANSISSLKKAGFSANEVAHVKNQLEDSKGLAHCERNGKLMLVAILKEAEAIKEWEQARVAGAAFVGKLNAMKRKEIQLVGLLKDSSTALAFVEGMVLGNYSFDEYKTKGRATPTLARLRVTQTGVTKKLLDEISGVCAGVCWARDLVNRPLSHLTATDLAKDIQKVGKQLGFKVNVLSKAKIQSLKMGGLLAVNMGSPDPPTFSILEWKPKNAVNKKPILLVGKGVVYDTGGLSLKPTANSMDMMKCDMAGAATMVGTMHAVSSQNLPLHVVALIPATDNRPGGNAYAPGDVITMHDGQTVEVLNTDAEGRMILADAHSYGKRYAPVLVIDAATLTGAAVRAIGLDGVVAMGTAAEKDFAAMENAGNQVYERLARMPFWDEFDKELDSDIADMKNLGGPYAGQITAGKFLARFIEAPYIHLDIAGPAFLPSAKGYRPKGGTGVGVRLLYQFLRNYSK